MNQKEKRALGMSPITAFIQEKPYLNPLPKVLPPIYQHVQRLVDSRGFVYLENNRYSVPEKLIGKEIDVYKYLNEVHLSYQHREIAIHPRLAVNQRGTSKLEGHHTQMYYEQSQRAIQKTEKTLRQSHEVLDKYVSELKKHIRGDGVRQCNQLLNFKRTYLFDAFIAAIEKAHHYGLYDLNRLEALIIKYVAGDYFNLVEEE